MKGLVNCTVTCNMLFMRKITANTIVELKAKVYAAHGWVRARGESQTVRIKTLYDLSVDRKKGKFVAAPKKEH